MVPDAENPFKIISINVLHGVDFRYSMKDIEIDGKNAYEFTIENTRTSPGRYLDQINILTDKSGNNPISIIISGNIKPSGPGTQGYGITPNVMKQ
ncbi:MAG: hypothetical protein C4518_10895 [Desulfobacteraceae bacterium]|nr:MAG: hypothetical protein C4518_10895 [Desulfobacteraceae bacterium]